MKFNFDITTKEFLIVKTILEETIFFPCQVFIFGSRAKNKAQDYSDLDLALHTKEKINAKISTQLKNAFEESLLPYTVDVVDINAISTSFKAIVDTHKKLFLSIENKTVPKLRFEEFENSYKEYKLSELIIRYSEKNKDEEFKIDDILSLSSKYGIVDRKEILGDTYANVNHLSYVKTRLNDFVYGKSISASFPYGLFKANKLRDGLLSTLYFTFKVRENIITDYLDIYFSHLNRANNFLKKFVLVGDRYITADANYILSGKIFIPLEKEQQKIITFFSAVDEKLQQLTKKKELLAAYKKGVMQQLFSQELRFKDAFGNNYPNWEEKKLGEVGETFNGLTGKTKEDFGRGKPYIQYMQIFSSAQIDASKFGLVDVKEGEKQKTAQYGDVFFTTSSETPMEIGYASVLTADVDELYLNSFCFGYRPNSINELYPDFSSYLFRSELLRKQIVKLAQGSTRYNMSKVQLMKVLIQLPSLEEQKKIANFLSSLDKKIDLVSTQIEKTKAFKKGLLQQMFV